MLFDLKLEMWAVQVLRVDEVDKVVASVGEDKVVLLVNVTRLRRHVLVDKEQAKQALRDQKVRDCRDRGLDLDDGGEYLELELIRQGAP